jgi:uncharacterized membrane protein YccC
MEMGVGSLYLFLGILVLLPSGVIFSIYKLYKAIRVKSSDRIIGYSISLIFFIVATYFFVVMVLNYPLYR